MKYLIVVAHPDDEVLGAGASIYKWTRNGDSVDVCIMSAEARTFPNIEMNTVSHLKLVQHIEAAIKESEPDIIITHHPADTNNDHLQTSMACQEAIRLFQRRPEVKRVKEFWYMEVPSCTEWKINNAMQDFVPNCYVEVGKDGVDAKIKALSMYRGVMRPYPHPRSAEYISGLAAVRGSQWGVNYAEAFEVVLRNY